MKITPKFSGIINDLSFNPDNPVRYKQRLTELQGKKVNVVVTRYRENRSDNQNRYYWKIVIGMITKEAGYTDDEKMGVHEDMKRMFLGTHGKLNIVKSSANLNTKEFEEYEAKIRMWASTYFPLYIPLPNECDY